MNPVLVSIFSAVIAFGVSLWTHPYILQLAKIKHITDDPNARKLQDSPVPVMGGIVVGFAILAGVLFARCFISCTGILPALLSGILMLNIGFIDDTISLSKRVRFGVEIILSLLLIGNGFLIQDLHGLFGIHRISLAFAIPLTMLTTIGVINAINLIDGVDGLCSGFCILACSCFFVIFATGGNWCWAILALVSALASVPFLLHNVFGRETHIYFGDSGTLMMGTLLSCFIMEILRNSTFSAGLTARFPSLSLVALVMAILAEPVTDCLRVMGWRMAKGLSPFHADRTHQHHLFIDARFSHPVTSLTIILTDMMIILAWFFAWRLGASQGVQFLVVVLLSFGLFGGFYLWMSIGRKKNSRNYRRFVWLGIHSHFKRTGFWRRMRTAMDRM